MNGVHDMGGMHGFGPIRPEANEPVFHARWEGRVHAMVLAMFPWRRWALDEFRSGIQSVPPADYLAMNYYERWYASLTDNMIRAGLVTRAEVENGRAAAGTMKATPPLTAVAAAGFVQNGIRFGRDVAVPASFRAGQSVRARNINPPTYTRLPRYARGRSGVVLRDYGVFVFPDTHAERLGEKPQHLYSVRFPARELWGEAALATDWVNLDLWEDYLEPA